MKGNISASKLNTCFRYTDARISLRVWSHICVVLHSQLYSFYKDAKLAVMYNTDTCTDDIIFAIPSGFFKASFSTNTEFYYYSGYIADPQMFPRQLTQDQIENVREGKTPKTHSCENFEKLKFVVDNVVSNNTHVLQNFSLEELLQPHANFTVVPFSIQLSYSQAAKVCQNLGGNLPNAELYSLEEIKNKCLQNYDIESVDIWLFTPSFSPETSQDDENCLMFSYKKVVGPSKYLWACKNIAFYLCCFIPSDTFIRLNGGDIKGENRLMFVQGSGPNNASLEGIKDLRVVWDDQEARIHTTDGSVTYSRSFTNNRLIMGRNEYTSQTRTVNFTLTTCGPRDFTCDSGQCIPLQKRCDTIPGDCHDYSDESFNCFYFKGTPEFYYKHRSPKNPRINVSITLDYVQEVDTNSNMLKVSI